jgi:hypothetical protein
MGGILGWAIRICARYDLGEVRSAVLRFATKELLMRIGAYRLCPQDGVFWSIPPHERCGTIDWLKEARDEERK